MADEKAASTAKTGFPTCSVLTILFVLLKVFGKIAWSWWLVFAPLWIPLVIVFVLFGSILLVGLMAALVDG